MHRQLKVGAIIQARVGSSRLPMKVLRDIEGKPMLQHVVARVRHSELVQEVIIATTHSKKDEAILELARKNKVKCFRGSEEDVLDRYYQVARTFQIDVVVRITADCPLVDPRVVDQVIDLFLRSNFDYVSNGHPPTCSQTYPDGLDTEVFTFRSLKKAWEDATKLSDREHVTSYIWSHPESFRIGNLENENDLSQLRWTVDEKDDLKFVQELYRRLYEEGKVFYMGDILKTLNREPELKAINEGITRDEGYKKSVKKDGRFDWQKSGGQ